MEPERDETVPWISNYTQINTKTRNETISFRSVTRFRFARLPYIWKNLLCIANILQINKIVLHIFIKDYYVYLKKHYTYIYTTTLVSSFRTETHKVNMIIATNIFVNTFLTKWCPPYDHFKITRRLYILQFKSSITDSSLSILHSYSSEKIIPIIPPTFMIQIKAGGPTTIGRLLSTVIITLTKLSSSKQYQ